MSSQVELVKALSSKNWVDRFTAQAAIAQAISSPLLGVIQQVPIISNIFGPAYAKTLGIAAQNLELAAKVAALQKDIDALKDIIG